MKNQIFITLFLIIGIFLVPTPAAACSSTKTESGCCKKSDKEKETKDCCKKAKSKSEKEENDCNGNCGNSSCSCSPIQISSFLIMHPVEIPEVEFQVFLEEILYVSGIYAQDYYFFWQPPKIG